MITDTASIGVKKVVPDQRWHSFVLPSLFAMLRDAWNMYIARLRIILAVMMVPVVVDLVSVVVSASPLFIQFVDSLTQPIILGLSIIVALLFLMLTALVQMALMHVIIDTSNTLTIREAYMRGASTMLAYLWTTLLASFLTIGGLFLFVIPGIVFITWFSFAVFILAQTDMRGMRALIQSREYVRGYFGCVLGRIMFGMILAIIVSYIVSEIFAYTILQFFDPSILFGYLFIMPMLTAFMYSIYKGLQVIKGQVTIPSVFKSTTQYMAIAVLGFILIPILMVFVTT